LEKQILVVRWPSNSPQICHVIPTCLFSFLLQGSHRYNLFHWIYFFLKNNWGGGEDVRKIVWVDWDAVCLSKEEGGLGVRRLKEFNVALLEKWCWRMLVDKEGLWFRVLNARYVEEGGWLKEGGKDSSV